MRAKEKNEKGFTTIDIGLAMLVTIMFVTIMSSMLYSVYLSSTEAKRTATALNYAVDIFETIGQMSFSDLEPEQILGQMIDFNLSEINSSNTDKEKVTTAKIGTYTLILTMTEPYADGTIKKFKLKITYPVSRKNTETLELERIRTLSRT